MRVSESAQRPAAHRHWPLTEKRRIVELTLQAGASISKVAHAHGVHPTSLSHWRTMYRSGKLGAKSSGKIARATTVSAAMLPVTVTAEQEHFTRSRESSVVHLTLASGAALRLETPRLDSALICALLAELRG
jgi:transposase-like protein